MRRTWWLSGVLAAGLAALVVAGGPAAASEDHEPDGAHADGPAIGHEADDHPGTDTSDGGAEMPGEHSGKTKLKARLSGLNEADATGKTGVGDLDGRGRAVVRLRDANRLCWDIRADGIGPVLMAHIHKAAIGANGGVVVDFEGQFSGCTEVAPALAADIAANPESYYVNVHTEEFQAGAVRGQLRSEQEEIELEARLRGDNEVDPPGGDPDGRGKLHVELRGTLLCWKFRSSGIEPVIAQHIHRGVAGTNGDVVVDFDGQSRGCRDIKAGLAAEIAADPSGFYGNMHTESFRAGAIRGQLKAGD
jgi:hypothetical protein